MTFEQRVEIAARAMASPRATPATLRKLRRSARRAVRALDEAADPPSVEEIADEYRLLAYELAGTRLDELGVPRVLLDGAYHAGLVERLDILAGRLRSEEIA